MKDNYIEILESSLREKNRVLDEIKCLSEKQSEVVSSESFALEDLDEFIEKKGVLIERLERLDDGFETLYEKVSEEVKRNREKYSDQILNMQNMIREITEKSNSIQALEKRNQAEINSYISKRKSEVKEGRMSSKAAMNYYNAQRNSAYNESVFMDSKQ